MLKNIFERRSAEESARRANRLPPGQSLTQKFPVLHYGPTPQIDLTTWTFKILGEVETVKTWTWAEFGQLPRQKLTLDIHCVTQWSKFDTEWEGVSVKTLVDEGIIRLKPTARYLIQHCHGGYTTNTPLDLALSERMLMATHYNGQPLDPDHGFPLRMVIGAPPDNPQAKSAYFWKGGKWLRALEFSTTDKPGFWERNGYHNDADPWLEQRFSGR